MPFAQLVIGSPGSGKSTYCDGMQQFLTAIERKCSVVNLDPANDQTSYPAALDVRDLVTLDEIMNEEELGPNGGVMYALEELEHNFEWLEEGLRKLGDDYTIFDCPGQVELFTHHASLRNIFFRLQKLGYRLIVLYLVDSFVLTQPSLYISALISSLRSMLNLDLPHLNVLTKIDNLASYQPPLPLPLSFYTEAVSLDRLLPFLAAEQAQPRLSPEQYRQKLDHDEEVPPTRFQSLNEAIVELVEDFALVGFETLAVENRQSMAQLLRVIDRTSGYAFGGVEGANQSVWQVAVREGGAVPGVMDVRDVEERWVDRREEYDELEERELEEDIRKDGAKNRRVQKPGEAASTEVGLNEEAALNGEYDEATLKHALKQSGVKVMRKN